MGGLLSEGVCTTHAGDAFLAQQPVQPEPRRTLRSGFEVEAITLALGVNAGSHFIPKTRFG